MLTRREKLVVTAIPIAIVIAVVWWLWISPRLTLIGVAGGSWADYSGVHRANGNGETVLTFSFASDEAQERLIGRLDFRPGDGGGNVGDIAVDALRSCGLQLRGFSRHISGRCEDGLMMLFLHEREAALVRINY